MQVIFDDSNEISEVIRDVIGNRGFSEVVVKRRKLEQFYEDSLQKVFPDVKLKTVKSLYEFQGLLKSLESGLDVNEKILHCFSNYIIVNEEQALLTFAKIKYIDSIYRVMTDGKIVTIMFPDTESY